MTSETKCLLPEACSKSSTLIWKKEQSQNETEKNVQQTISNGRKKGLLRQLQSPFCCNFCDKSFTYYSQMRMHRMVHTQERPYVCLLCSKAFKRKNEMKVHLQTHLGNKLSYECGLCNRSFSKKDTLKWHMESHTKRNVHVCDVCGKSFTMQSYLYKHKMRHTQKKAYSCEICDKSFSDKAYMKRHKMLRHSNEMNGDVMCGKFLRSESTELAGQKKTTESCVHMDSILDLTAEQCLDEEVERNLNKSVGERQPAQESCNIDSENQCLLPETNSTYAKDFSHICKREQSYEEAVDSAQPTINNVGNQVELFPYQDVLPETTSNCSELFFLANKMSQSCQEAEESVQQSVLDGGEKGILGRLLSRKSFSCSVCNKTFNCYSQMRMHRMVHTREKPYVCKLCSKAYKRKNELKVHLQIHIVNRPSYNCRYCSRSFSTKDSLKWHVKLHAEKNVYVCDICGNSFTMKCYLNKHRMRHIQRKSYSCEICNKPFSDKYYMKRHKMVHSYKTDSGVMCSKALRSESNHLACQKKPTENSVHVENVLDLDLTAKQCLKDKLERKINESSGEKQSAEVYYSLPEITSTNAKDFVLTCKKEQSFREAEQNVRQISCDAGIKVEFQTCQDFLPASTSNGAQDFLLSCKTSRFSEEAGENVKQTTLESGETDLVRQLQRDKSFSCSICNKTFRCYSQMRMHRMVHTQERPYVCQLCNKAFKRKNEMKVHLQTHIGNRPSHNCGFCNKSFNTKDSIMWHMKLHAERNIHVCDICGKTFTMKGYLNKHKIRHTQKKSYSCEICNKPFSDKYYLKRHKMRMHSNEMNSGVRSELNGVACEKKPTEDGFYMENISDLTVEKCLDEEIERNLSETSSEKHTTQDFCSIGSENMLSELTVHVKEEKIDEPGEDWVKIRKEKDPLAISGQEPLREASTDCTKDFLFVCKEEQPCRDGEENIQQFFHEAGEKLLDSKELHVNVEEHESAESGEEMDILEDPIKVEKEALAVLDQGHLLKATSNQDFIAKYQCTYPEATSAKDFVFTCEKKQSYQEAYENVQQIPLDAGRMGLSQQLQGGKSCNVCGKTFKDRRNMRRHRMIHTKEKPYLCSFCNKAFARKYNMKIHLRTHTRDTS